MIDLSECCKFMKYSIYITRIEWRLLISRCMDSNTLVLGSNRDGRYSILDELHFHTP